MIRRILFDLWYIFGRPPWDTGISPPELLSFLENHSPGRAIDLGCGTGTNVITLAQHGWHVTGVDLSGKAIQMARRKTRLAGVQAELHQCNVTLLKGVSGPFDLALDIGCFHGLPLDRARRYIAKLGKLVSPGGTYLLYTWINTNPDEAGEAPTESSIHQLLGETFELVNAEYGTDRQHSAAWFTFRRRC
jgi:cyclopropane fatty-acyl-phospholipid synthase-like methyltransferase